MLTNYELAKTPSFPVAATFLECPSCNCVTNELSTNPHIPCSNCNTEGVKRLFPDASCIELLEMIAYFYVKACDRKEDLKIELVNNLKSEVGRTYDTQSIVDTVKEIQNCYRREGHSEYERMLEVIRKRLCLQSNEEAQKVFSKLFTYSETFEEHKVVVIPTCVMLEKLFYNLLVLLNVCNRMAWSEAYKKVEGLGDFDKRCKAFKKITNISLETAIGECNIPDFFGDWNEVRKKRNKFIHTTPYAIDITVAEKAFNLAKHAFPLFASLQNRFCARQTRSRTV